MRMVVKLIAALFALVVVIFVLQGIASETGEVVVLTTQDQTTSEPVTTRLWVVDHDGAMWLRGDRQSGWSQRALAQPAPVQLERDNVSYTLSVAAQPAQVELVNQLMRQKYGWRDQLISLMAPREDSVALRLSAVE